MDTGFLKLAIIGVLGFAPAALSHHSLNAEFDMNRTITWKGEVVSIDWAAPHVYISLAVKDAAGRIAVWKLQSNPPHMLQADGVTRNTVKVGSTLTVTGLAPRKSGSHSGFAREVELPDGRRVTFGSLTWEMRE